MFACDQALSSAASFEQSNTGKAGGRTAVIALLETGPRCKPCLYTWGKPLETARPVQCCEVCFTQAKLETLAALLRGTAKGETNVEKDL